MRTHTSLREAVRAFDEVLRLIRTQPGLELARTADDIERLHQAGRIASLIGVEGGHMIENSSAAIRVFHELGPPYLTLTHWDNVEWADAATDRADHIDHIRLVAGIDHIGIGSDFFDAGNSSMAPGLGDPGPCVFDIGPPCVLVRVVPLVRVVE